MILVLCLCQFFGSILQQVLKQRFNTQHWSLLPLIIAIIASIGSTIIVRLKKGFQDQ